MKINKLWYVCILVRLSMILIIRYFNRNPKSKSKFIPLILMAMGLGFMFKAITGSNNETQVAKVFWHETRYVHGSLYLLAAYYLYKKNLDMNSMVLFTDVVFSFIYRFYTRQ